MEKDIHELKVESVYLCVREKKITALKLLYSRVSNRRDSPLINYSVFCHPPQPYSALPL